MAISRWAICLVLSLACWLALALVVWAQAPAWATRSRYAPRAVSTGSRQPPAARSAAAAANPTPPAPVASDPLVKWQLLGRSPDGRPLEYVQFGAGEHQVLVIGALRGNEPEGVALAQSLASHLARFPRRIEDVTITIVRDPNPDGRARQIPGNGRGVALDQNFLAMRQVAGQPAGPHMAAQSGSEPETIAIVELLHDVKPERVILLGTSAGRAMVQFTGPAEALAAQVAFEGGAPCRPLDTSAAPGALLTFTGINLGIPSLEMAMMPRATADAVWSQQKRALLTAVGCGTPLPFVPVPFQPRRPKASAAKADPAVARPLAAAAAPAAGPPMPFGPQPPFASQPPFGPQPAAARGQPAADAPQALNFREFRYGRPTVQVQSPRAIRSRQTGRGATLAGAQTYPTPAAPQPGTAWGHPLAPGADPRVKRLPPVKVYQPQRREISRDMPLPQRPIPVYPSTGQ
ncbi:MAG TPA: M14 family zinc carboxypeptidase [Pirellulales bacterium]